MDQRTTHVVVGHKGQRLLSLHRTPEGADRAAKRNRKMAADFARANGYRLAPEYYDCEPLAVLWSLSGATFSFVCQA